MSQTILIIEDNENNRYLTSFLLEHNGYTVKTATDGPAGIALAEALEPDIILLDVQLPGMDGYEVAHRVRSLPSLARIPMVAVTSYAMGGDRERAMEAGCTGYIEKPIDPDTFVDELRRHLDA